MRDFTRPSAAATQFANAPYKVMSYVRIHLETGKRHVLQYQGTPTQLLYDLNLWNCDGRYRYYSTEVLV